MAPSVIETLLGWLPPSQPAFVKGYKRHPVRGFVFPGMIQAANTASAETTRDVVQGKVYHQLTDHDWYRLDWFEGEEYQRHVATVHLQQASTSVGNDSKTDAVSCPLYLWSNPIAELNTLQEWDYDAFVQQHLEQYIAKTVQPCRIELDRKTSRKDDS